MCGTSLRQGKAASVDAVCASKLEMSNVHTQLQLSINAVRRWLFYIDFSFPLANNSKQVASTTKINHSSELLRDDHDILRRQALSFDG